MALTTQQKQDVGALLEQHRQAEPALVEQLARGGSTAEARATVADLERQIEDIFVSAGYPKGRRTWGTGVGCDIAF